MRPTFPLLAMSAAVLLTASGARADWPSARHDPQRTGVATANSDIVNPAVY